MKTHSTKQAAKLIGVHLVTLQRWLSKAIIRPSIAVPMKGRTFWRWTPEDVTRAKKLVGTFKTGPVRKAKAKK